MVDAEEKVTASIHVDNYNKIRRHIIDAQKGASVGTFASVARILFQVTGSFGVHAKIIEMGIMYNALREKNEYIVIRYYPETNTTKTLTMIVDH